jgi:predicted porin
MKRNSLAVAAVTLLCGAAAHAQSSVTLFGVVDSALQRVVTQDKSSVTRLVSGSDQTSRIGFRGVEDLGGGMSAGFWLEAGIAMDSGTGAATNSNNQTTGAGTAGGLLFDRRSTVSLSGNWGELRLGRDYVPTYWNVTRADPFFRNGVGSNGALIGAGAISAPTFVRASNSIGYFLPGNLGGFYGQAMVALGENASNAPNADDGRYVGVRLGWAKGPIDIAIASATTKYLGGDFTVSNVGGSYDFGVVKVSALWNESRVKAPLNQKQRDYLLGAVVPVGSGEIKASYTHSSITSSATGAGANLLAVGYGYNLSKRTALYAHYARVNNHGGATFSNAAVAPAANGQTTGYEVGVRHFF